LNYHVFAVPLSVEPASWQFLLFICFVLNIVYLSIVSHYTHHFTW